MSNLISQSELINAAMSGWDTYAEKLGLVLPDVLSYREWQTEWTYDVLDADSPNGSRANLERLWVFADSSGTTCINGIDITSYDEGGTYRCKSGSSNYTGFRMQTAIERIYQVAWRDFDVIQMEEGTTGGGLKVYPPLSVNFPVFSNYQDGVDFSTAMYNYLENPTDISLNIMKAALSKSDNPGKKKSPEYGPYSEPGGGYNQDTPQSDKGSFDDTSDIITPSSKPTLTPLSSNLVHAYKVTTAILNDIADAIYVDLANDWSSVETALEAIYNAIFAAKYVDFLLDLLILPINVPAPNLVNIKVGGKYLTLSSGRIQANLVTDPYVDFDCGSITIPEYWANFLDYTGTKVKLFLPYIGYVDIQPEYIISGELNVKYRFNVLDGSFIVYVMSSSGKSELTSSMIGQYAGVAAVHVPLQASDYATKVSGLISAIGTVAAGMAAGGVGAMTGAANLGNTLMQKPGSTHANGYNASSSYLSHRCPYLIIERQVSQFSQKYPEEVGLPLNVMRTLGSMQGLTKCEAAHLDTIPCSIEGKEKISQLFAEGIIL